MTKLAIIQCADEGPLCSLVNMLESVGYTCRIPDERLRAKLRNVFGDKGLVLSPRDLTRSMGYDPVKVPEIGVEGMASAAVYVDVKAHRVAPLVEREWPQLKGRVLWWRIQGGKPEHVVNARGDHGDEVNPPCPVLTANLWYKHPLFNHCPISSGNCDCGGDDTQCVEGNCTACGEEGVYRKVREVVRKYNPDAQDYCAPYQPCRAYACWPPFTRASEYFDERGRAAGGYTPPICLVHGINGWGYGALIDSMRGLGVKCYGTGAPDGLIQHRDVPRALAGTLAMVHLKSNDAPGYSMLECLAAACPLICTRRMIWRCAMQDLLIPNETCLVFDRETHDGLTPQDVAECTAEVAGHLERLRDPEFNRKIGPAGYERLKQVMWSADRAEDVASLRGFMERHFGG